MHSKSCHTSRSGVLKSTRRLKGGFSVLEMSVVVFVIVCLLAATVIGFGPYREWEMAKSGAEALRTVLVAQRAYLADHPAAPASSLTESLLVPYLPNAVSAFPQVKALDGSYLTIDPTTVPPRLKRGGAVYDPSGKPDDGLWDCGI